MAGAASIRPMPARPRVASGEGKSCQHKPNAAEQCRKRGGVWNGQTCLTPADLCKAKGWSWDGKNCKPPAPSLVPRGSTAKPRAAEHDPAVTSLTLDRRARPSGPAHLSPGTFRNGADLVTIVIRLCTT
jgi:hypothetical protein